MISTFLCADELRHITPIKMRAMFGNALRVVPIDAHSSSGYCFTMPCAGSQWARTNYPNTMHCVYVALPANADTSLIAMAARAVLRETQGESFVVVTIEPSLIEALQVSSDVRMPLRFRLALLTFTPQHVDTVLASIAINPRNASGDDVASRCYAHIPDEARALLAAHDVYSNDELKKIFADGSARCWLRIVGDVPVAVVLTFANSKTLHEIGSLYVQPRSRRAGHADALVREALRDLAVRGLKVRYVVDAENAASIALAGRCGLREALRSEHWLSG